MVFNEIMLPIFFLVPIQNITSTRSQLNSDIVAQRIRIRTSLSTNYIRGIRKTSPLFIIILIISTRKLLCDCVVQNRIYF